MEEQVTLQIIKQDPYLQPYKNVYHRLINKFNTILNNFKSQGGLLNISQSYKTFGIHQVQNQSNTYLYKQWAPGIQQLSIFGDFNNWNRNQYKAIKNNYGHWTIKFVTKQPIKQFSKVKVQVQLGDGRVQDRIPAWINFTTQHQHNKTFDGVFVKLANYQFQHKKPTWQTPNIRVYQSHVGMCGITPKIHSFTDFKDIIIPLVEKEGYNVIQLMAILQHPYYGSFGYHVSSFFSISSRFGTPNQFKQLIDEAHKRNIKVIIDLVHAHAAKNSMEGINYWDGTQYQYFHDGAAGNHSQWDSRIFDYSKYQVLRFLLSNIRFWLEQYQADGFRFDGVTSMLYKHRGLNYGFTGSYHEYFNDNLDQDAIAYLMCANHLAKLIDKNAILVAEDVSGFPGLCRNLEDGGVGFNFRLAMAIPDMWVKFLKQIKDQDWDMQEMAYTLTNRRWKQNNIAYAESHDQALVGGKTLSMWLFDAQIYTNMSTFNHQTPRIFRGIALHKMIRLVSFALGGQAYLNFMGNQFGHPEWIDFPREGNGWSLHYCRRRWDLATDKELRYKFLLEFDREMIKLDINYHILGASYQYVRTKNNNDKVLVFQKDNLLFVFNWHSTTSHISYPIYCQSCPKAKVLWSTDDYNFGGHGRVHHETYQTTKQDELCSKFLVFLPSRSAIVFDLSSDQNSKHKNGTKKSQKQCLQSNGKENNGKENNGNCQ